MVSHKLIQATNGVLFCKGFAHSSAPTHISYTCTLIDSAIENGTDAALIVPTHDVVLDVIPGEENTRSTVTFGDEVGPGVLRMRLIHTREVGGTTALDIGVWMQGEGRKSIRQTIWNYMAGCLDPRDVNSQQVGKIYTRCPNPAHSLQSQRRMEEKIQPNTTYKSVCLFNMIFEKMCTECLSSVSNNDDFGLPVEAGGWGE